MITIIFNNLIAGIIIDSFCEQRTEQQELESDQQYVCYICGLKKQKIDRCVPFKRHIEIEHHPWNYIYYIY